MKKEKKLDFRCTELEYQELEKRAQSYGMKSSQYVREYLFNDTSRKREFFSSNMNHLIKLQDLTSRSIVLAEHMQVVPNSQKQLEELKNCIKASIELEKKIWDI